MTEVTAAFKTNEKVTSKIFYAHTYDIDIVKVLQGFKHPFSHQLNLIPELNTVAYVEEVTSKIQEYCQRHDINFDYHINTGNLVIAADDADYAYFMALQLSIIDFNRISAFLDHHYEHYSNTEVPFCNLLQFRVYDLLKNKSPFIAADSKIQLLMEWLSKKKQQLEVLREQQKHNDAVLAAIANVAQPKKKRLTSVLQNGDALKNQEDERLYVSNLTSAQILQYFVQLVDNKKDDGSDFWSRAELDYFLGNTFQGFARPENKKLIEPNMNQAQIMDFVARFYTAHLRKEKSITRKAIAARLIDTFKQFERTTVETLSKNLTKEKDCHDYLFKNFVK